jgi:two-component system NarL family sensor kinase
LEKFGPVTALQKQILATMSRSHRNSLHIVETLLHVYRNERLGLQLTLVPLDLAALVQEAIASLSPLAAKAQVYFSLNFGGSDFRHALLVKGDRIQLQRVLTNLLINAVQHSRRNSRIEISLESGACYQEVRILDQGAGITPEELPYLFQYLRQIRGEYLTQEWDV